MSHHLRILRDAGLLRVDRRGTWAYYELVQDARERISRAVDAFLHLDADAQGGHGQHFGIVVDSAEAVGAQAGRA